MQTKLRNDLWITKRSADVLAYDKFVLQVFALTGLIGIGYLLEWWFRIVHIGNLVLYVILSTFFWYSILRLLLIWVNYLWISKPLIVPKSAENLSVAVFTTAAPGEPLSMFENTFKALKNLNYPHTTYLLDSTEDLKFKALAEKYDVVWFDLANLPGAKAGKVNEALRRTQEEFILILDPDHIVFPNFLDETLGFFQDEKVGFVQVSQGYYNMYRSFVAKGAAEQTYTFYGPTQMGLSGFNGAVAIGANCTFRREALESIGGHAMGLAEDLQTSIRIHAKGWKSIYNPVMVSRGLVPEDFASFSKQQLKWARGVFELLFDEYPYVIGKLSFWQKISYLAIGTYYLFGTLAFFFVALPYFYFFLRLIPANMDIFEFVQKGIVVLMAAISIYLYIQKFLVDKKTESGFHWRGMILKFSTVPLFFYAFLLTLLKKKIPYIPTEKMANRKFYSVFLLPSIIYSTVFILTAFGEYVYRRFYIPESELYFTRQMTWGMLAFGFVVFIQAIVGMYFAWQSSRIKVENAWERIQINEDKTFSIR
jgi:cellulose synthase (UDP-forming)